VELAQLPRIFVTASDKLFRSGIIASKHINFLVAWAGISATQRLIAMPARAEIKGCRLSFLSRAYCVFLSATEPQKFNEIGRRDRTCTEPMSYHRLPLLVPQQIQQFSIGWNTGRDSGLVWVPTPNLYPAQLKTAVDLPKAVGRSAIAQRASWE